MSAIEKPAKHQRGRPIDQRMDEAPLDVVAALSTSTSGLGAPTSR
jgi:hypothetical protein